MIYYNAKIYTMNSPISGNLNDWQYIEDCIWSVLELGDKFVEQDVQGETSELYSILNGIAGSQVDAIYNFPYANGVPSEIMYNLFKQQLPSVISNAKKSYEYYMSNYSANLRFGVYIPTLNRFFVSDTFYNVASVNNNILSFYGQSGINFCNTYISSSDVVSQFLVMKRYTDSESLIDTNNFGLLTTHLHIGVGNSFAGVGVITNKLFQSPRNWSRTHLLNIFGNNPDVPDGTGFPPPPNPYQPGGPSGPTDPDLPPGTFDDESDPIPDSPLPTLSAANTGFTRIYNPTLAQVQALAQYLWTTPDIIETIWNHIKQFFENPMDAIIGFNVVPVPVPDGGTENFKLMYIDTGVAMTAAANQFVDRDCGTVEIKRYYGSALDQSPYTKVSCFLPYIGTVQLNTDEVMGTTLQVKYRVDICSGSCVAKIFIDGNCLYQYSGHCAINIPISSADFSSYVSAAINVAKLAIGAATAGAGGAAMAAAQVVGSEQQTGNMFTSQFGGSSQNLPALPQYNIEPQQSEQTTTSASFAGLSPANISNTVGEIMNAKPHVEHSGSFSGNTGYLGVRRPFIIIERPNMCMPANYQALNGFPAMITMELGTCKGFTRVQQVQLTGMTATNPEQAEILELLKSGVVL